MSVGDVIPGVVVDITPEGLATITATIPLDDYTRKGYKNVLIYLTDSRQLSDKQRRFCYSLIAAIADAQGEHVKTVDRELTKQYMKLRFITEDIEPLAQHLFSMSNAPMDIIVGFQKFLIEIVLEYDIPTKFSLLEYIDENSISDYVYACLIHKKCCICGKKADLHHVDRIGMGGNRDEVIHEGMHVLPLYREFHTENHNIGDTEFFKKYHLDGGIVMDKTLCKIWKVKAGKEVIEE